MNKQTKRVPLITPNNTHSIPAIFLYARTFLNQAIVIAHEYAGKPDPGPTRRFSLIKPYFH